jgi:hypothetical protein
MIAQLPEDEGISYALVCLRTGAVLGATGGTLDGRLENLAAASAELLQTHGALDLSSLFVTLGSRKREDGFRELVLLSDDCVYVVQRSLGRPDTALLAVGAASRKLGLLLSSVRARFAALETSP